MNHLYLDGQKKASRQPRGMGLLNANSFYLVGVVKSVPFRNQRLGWEARMIGGIGLTVLFVAAGSMSVAVLAAV